MPNALTLESLREIHDSPLLELVVRAANVHRRFHDSRAVQVSSLLSIKTGGCPEDCGYCPQAARYHTGVEAHALLPTAEVLARARTAKENGASRFCMGAAWRQVRDNREFEQVIEMVRAVRMLGMETCATLGMLTVAQARRLAEAGLYAYNHNVDTSPEYYGEIISTRTIEDRLQTLQNVRDAGITVCCGGIIGMGESIDDRLRMVQLLAELDPPPESIPINALVPVAGTPLGEQPPVPAWDLIRMIATVRIAIPTAVVRLSAGRTRLSVSEQALCFLAGAGSIFSGERLLTTTNPDFPDDRAMFELLGLVPREPYAERREKNTRAEVEASARGMNMQG
ncbi:MAG: biotin synthase BioB [Planctomycetes bacterium]|nr:biotin synthase BioB [Planctomycetota bacterium]